MCSRKCTLRIVSSNIWATIDTAVPGQQALPLDRLPKRQCSTSATSSAPQQVTTASMQHLGNKECLSTDQTTAALQYLGSKACLSTEHATAAMQYLSNKHCPSEEHPRLPQRQERQQVHALIFSLLQQSVDPAIVPPHGSQGLHVSQHPTNHSRHTYMISNILSHNLPCWLMCIH